MGVWPRSPTQIITSHSNQLTSSSEAVGSLSSSISRWVSRKILRSTRPTQRRTPWLRNSKTMMMKNRKHCQLIFRTSQHQIGSGLIKVWDSTQKCSSIWCVRVVEAKKCNSVLTITSMSAWRKKWSAYLPLNVYFANKISRLTEVTNWTSRRSRISTSFRSALKKFSPMRASSRIRKKRQEAMTAS